ncbi:hypothetical protein JJ691_37840 [Kutzneria sp. CA-103260]|nr:hypothetical protein JJ691_37840 [Kutzneria sp. CA-103260]
MTSFVRIDDLTTAGDPLGNDQYWRAACAALPPLSDRAVNSIAGALDRIETRTVRRSTA